MDKDPQRFAGMRDILIHEYFGVDTEMVWNTVQHDLPAFKTQVQEILATLSGKERRNL